MTQEDKELLLKDLCARLPYRVKASYYGAAEEREIFDEIESVTLDGYVDIGQYCLSIEHIKPYLRPLSSMPEGYWGDFYCKFVENEITYNDFKTYYFDSGSWDKVLTTICDCGDVIDWFNKYHFDYRGLIEKGLAIDATGLNIY